MSRFLQQTTRFTVGLAIFMAPIVSLAQKENLQEKQYWIGVHAIPAHDAIKAQLGIENGLIVQHLVEDGPAATSGVKQHDVMVKYGDKKLSELNDLVEAIAQSEAEEVTIELIRSGKQKQIKIKPAERPAEIRSPARDNLLKLFPELKGRDGNGPLRFQFARPGFALPGEAYRRIEKQMNIDGTNILIKKDGKGPANIVVERDGEKWEVTENQLDTLPEDVRAIVQKALERKAIFAQDAGELGSNKWLQQFLRNNKMPNEMREDIERWMKRLPKDGQFRVPQIAPSGDLEKKLDEVVKKLDELQGELKGLRDDVDKLKSEKGD